MIPVLPVLRILPLGVAALQGGVYRIKMFFDSQVPVEQTVSLTYRPPSNPAGSTYDFRVTEQVTDLWLEEWESIYVTVMNRAPYASGLELYVEQIPQHANELATAE